MDCRWRHLRTGGLAHRAVGPTGVEGRVGVEPERLAGRSALPADSVFVREEDLPLPTYMPAPPDKNPMFLEKRVYQGSSGKVYPLPFTDRISETAVDRKWKAIWIENRYIRALICRRSGANSRVAGQNKRLRCRFIASRSSSLRSWAWLAPGFPAASNSIGRSIIGRRRFCRWILRSNSTPDGSKTIWCSDHDPMCRMKGMHGVCLHPGKSFLELKVRAYNRTPLSRLSCGGPTWRRACMKRIKVFFRRTFIMWPITPGVR